MIEEITAVEFVGRTPTGKTRPAFVIGRKTDGQSVEVVLKLSDASERGVAGLAMEAVVACLAGDLGLPVPQPFIATITPAFIDATSSVDNDWAQAALRSQPKAFASTRAPSGFTTWVPGGKIGSPTDTTAAAILLLDAVGKNADRRPENPNLLVRGEEFRIIDHELCFPTFLLGLGNAWDVGGLQAMGTQDWHVLRDGLKGQEINWHDTIASWQSLSDEMIDGYAAALPAEWTEGLPAISQALARIKAARDRIEDCTVEVQRILR